MPFAVAFSHIAMKLAFLCLMMTKHKGTATTKQALAVPGLISSRLKQCMLLVHGVDE